MSQIWIRVHSVFLVSPKHVAESNRSPQNLFPSGEEPLSRKGNVIAGCAPSFTFSARTPSERACCHSLRWQLLGTSGYSVPLVRDWRVCGPSSLNIRHTNQCMEFLPFAWIAQRPRRGVCASAYARCATGLVLPQTEAARKRIKNCVELDI